MSIVMLFMQRKAIAQGLMDKLKDSVDIHLIYVADYAIAKETIVSYDAQAVLIEATESGHYNIDYCLNLCQKIRKNTPECKLLLMCSDQDEYCIQGVVAAKGNGLIDDFVFYDASIDYLASKILAIS